MSTCLNASIRCGHPRAPPLAGQTQARTIKKSVVVHGRGLHSGVRTGVILHPMPPGTGIVFGAISASDVTIPATVEYVDSTGYATSLWRDGVAAQTIEHLMSACMPMA